MEDLKVRVGLCTKPRVHFGEVVGREREQQSRRGRRSQISQKRRRRRRGRGGGGGGGGSTVGREGRDPRVHFSRVERTEQAGVGLFVGRVEAKCPGKVAGFDAGGRRGGRGDRVGGKIKRVASRRPTLVLFRRLEDQQSRGWGEYAVPLLE